MHTKFLVGCVVAVGILLSRPPQSLASCGQAFCPIETSTTAERHPYGGEFQFNLSYEFIDMDDPYIGTDSARVGEIPRPHDEEFTRNQTIKFSLDYGISSRWSVGLLVPFLDRLHQHLAHEEEEVVGGGLGETEVVDRTERWRYQAVGDLQFTTRYLLLKPETPLRPSFSLLLGMKVPTGRTNVKDDNGEKAELTLQPGNGSWDGIVGLSYVQNFSVTTVQRQTALAPLFVTALGRFPVGTGKFGYRPGGELFLNVGTAYPLFRKFDLLAQVNFYYRDRDDVGHAPGVEQADTGKETLFLSPGVRYHVTDNLAVYALMQFAVYRRVNGIQLTSDWNVTSGISYRFNLFPHA
jgi:outer membrane putative beta-barrel porin/alpha-amylase